MYFLIHIHTYTFTSIYMFICISYVYKRIGMHAYIHTYTIFVGAGIYMGHVTFFTPSPMAPAVAAAIEIPGDQLYPLRRI